MNAAAAVLYAVVVGWNGGPRPEVPALRYADDDAAAWAALLREAGARTTLLTRYDEETRAVQGGVIPDGPPTRERLLGALSDVEARMAEDARAGRRAELYFVYSGHGDVDAGEGFVQLDGDRLWRRDLRDRVLDRPGAARTHVVVDACKSYYLVYARGEAGSRRARAASFVDARLPGDLPGAGFLLSTSADNESHEWERFHGGVFGHEVRSALRGAADLDGDGVVSYAEVGAFVERANAGIPSPRYRPAVTVTPPRAAVEGPRAPLLAWGAAAASRALTLDRPLGPGRAVPGRFHVEDERGRRLVDANLGAPVTLHLPTRALWLASAEREVSVPADPAGRPLAISQLAAAPLSTRTRGAVHAAFEHLYAEALVPAAVEAWVARPPEADAPPPAWPPRLRLAAGVTAIAATAAGLGATFGALLVRDQGFGASQAARVSANQSIAALTGTSIGLYAVGGVAALGWVIVQRWVPPAASIRPAPGPGEAGLSLSASF